MATFSVSGFEKKIVLQMYVGKGKKTVLISGHWPDERRYINNHFIHSYVVYIVKKYLSENCTTKLYLYTCIIYSITFLSLFCHIKSISYPRSTVTHTTFNLNTQNVSIHEFQCIIHYLITMLINVKQYTFYKLKVQKDKQNIHDVHIALGLFSSLMC